MKKETGSFHKSAIILAAKEKKQFLLASFHMYPPTSHAVLPTSTSYNHYLG
jgi:hypothetical protein